MDNDKVAKGVSGRPGIWYRLVLPLTAGVVIGAGVTLFALSLIDRPACCTTTVTFDGESFPICAWTKGAKTKGCKEILGNDWEDCKLKKRKCKTQCDSCPPSD